MQTELQPFVTDMERIRREAWEKMEEGPVTGAFEANRAKVIQVFNDVLATEIVCALRYWQHYYNTKGLEAEVAADEFMEHAMEEEEHQRMVSKRIAQLGGKPDFNPKNLLTRSHVEYREGAILSEMIEEDLAAERIAIQTYTDIVRWLGEADPTSRRIMEDILAQEEEHADEMASLLTSFK